MIHFKNTKDKYGLIAYILHWSMAFLMIGLLGLGLYMTTLPIGLLKLKLYGWHKSFGILVLGIFFIRLIWRMSNIVPRLPDTLPVLQKITARAVHFVFYIFMIIHCE